MTPFAGVRVLLVEDEGTIALLIEEMLEDFGCAVVASVARFAQALDAAATAQVDLAILDVNLAGERVFPVADILRSRDIPLLFSTATVQRRPCRVRRIPCAAQAVLGKPAAALHCPCAEGRWRKQRHRLTPRRGSHQFPSPWLLRINS